MTQRGLGLGADLFGRVAAITGAAGGIGRALANTFAQNGADLFLMDVDPGLESLRAEIEPACAGRVVCHLADLGVEGAAQLAAEHCLRAFGRCDVLINNAAIGGGGPLEEIPPTEWKRTLHINLHVPLMLSQSFYLLMMRPAGAGRIINMASQAGVVALDGQGSYCVSKAALIALTRSMASEWGSSGVSAVAVAPTVVETAFALGYWQGEVARRHIEQIPSGRFAKPQEVAAACLFLASDAAQMVNGTVLTLDGGFTIR